MAKKMTKIQSNKVTKFSRKISQNEEKKGEKKKESLIHSGIYQEIG